MPFLCRGRRMVPGSTSCRMAGRPTSLDWLMPLPAFQRAGRGDGFADQRHLWPAWFHLIKECRPEHVFGEQVAAAVGHQWLDLVQSDMEGQGYRVGAAVLGAHSVGAPHIRQRLWFVADADGRNACAERQQRSGEQRQQPEDGLASELGNSIGSRLEGLAGDGDNREEPGRQRAQPDGSTATAGFWSDCDWLPCRDGKARPVEPCSFPLAHGIPARVVRLRAYGNSIVPQVGAEFIGAYLGVRGAA